MPFSHAINSAGGLKPIESAIAFIDRHGDSSVTTVTRENIVEFILKPLSRAQTTFHDIVVFNPDDRIKHNTCENLIAHCRKVVDNQPLDPKNGDLELVNYAKGLINQFQKYVPEPLSFADKIARACERLGIHGVFRF